MNRLTEKIKTESGTEFRGLKDIKTQDYIDALGDYEETGLTADEIKAIKNENNLLKEKNMALVEENKTKATVSVPCRPGDIIYTIDEKKRGCLIRKHEVVDVSLLGTVYLKGGKRLDTEAADISFSLDEACEKLKIYLTTERCHSQAPLNSPWGD